MAKSIEKSVRILPMVFDPVFKSVLQDKDSEDYLIDIISEITGIEKENLKGNIRFKNVEHIKDEIKEKGKKSDLIIEIKGHILNLEMNSYLDGTFDKNDRYIDKIKDGLVKEGDDYKNIIKRKIIQINFDDFKLFDERIIVKFRMVDEERGIIRSDYVKNTEVEIYHVNLQNVRNLYYTKDSLSKFEKELLLMTLKNEKELTKISKGDKEMESVAKKISKISLDEELQGIYDKEEQEEFIKNRIKYHATLEGFEQGEKKGIEQGRVEEKIEIAKNMLKNNMNDEIIIELTGLSKEELSKLK